MMIKASYAAIGAISLLLALAGVVLPILPTVPLLIFAAFCFARSVPRLERWLLNHPRFGADIRNWRELGAISRSGKRLAILMLGASAIVAILLLDFPLVLVPLAAGGLAGGWILTRPES